MQLVNDKVCFGLHTDLTKNYFIFLDKTQVYKIVEYFRLTKVRLSL